MSETPVGVEQKRRGRPPNPANEFTDRELQVFIGIARGKGNKEIGKAIGLKENTVKTYARRVFKKNSVNTRAGLVAWGYRQTLLKSLRVNPMAGTGEQLTAGEVGVTRHELQIGRATWR